MTMTMITPTDMSPAGHLLEQVNRVHLLVTQHPEVSGLKIDLTSDRRQIRIHILRESNTWKARCDLVDMLATWCGVPDRIYEISLDGGVCWYKAENNGWDIVTFNEVTD